MGIDPIAARLDYTDDGTGQITYHPPQGIEMDDPIPVTGPQLEHLGVLMRAFALHVERDEAYGDVWKNYGALSNLLSAARKVDRLMNVWWRNDGSIPALHKDLLDDAYDAINYLTFFIRNARAGNIAGSVPERPDNELPGMWERADLIGGKSDADAMARCKCGLRWMENGQVSLVVGREHHSTLGPCWIENG